MSKLYAWDGDAWVKTKVVCGRCGVAEWVEAVLSAELGDRGSVELSVTHGLPEGWANHAWDGQRCTNCVGGK